MGIKYILNSSSGGNGLKEKINTKDLVYISLLIAVNIVFSKFLCLRLGIIYLSFSFIAIVFATLKYNYFVAAIVASIADILRTIVFGTNGFYFPGYTLSCFLIGIVGGLCLSKLSLKRIIIYAICTQIFFSLILNTYWTSVITGKTFWIFVPKRVLQTIIMIFIKILTVHYLFFKRRLHEKI